MRRTRKNTSGKATEVQRKSRQPDEAAVHSLEELQRSGGNQAMLQLLSTGALQTKSNGSQPTAAGLATTPGATEGADAAATPAPVRVAPSLIVEDEAKEVGPGQMRKSDFLSQLRSAVCSTAEEALAGTMWSAMGCPYIERWLDHYSKQPSAYVERALRKYAPETGSVRSAADYLPLVTQRVRRGIEEWRSTGEVKDLPEEFAAGDMPGATVGGLVGGLLSGVGSAISGLVSGAGRAMGGALSSVGSMLFKRRAGSEAGTEGDPEAIRAELGSGQALDGSVQRRMQSAFGVDFAGVRVHTGGRAREMSEGLGARAFTIGNDIAFGGAEYQPGTPVGDALIAHELAHVVQQGGESSAATAQHKGGAESGSLEEDADRSAVGAMVKLWTGARGELSEVGQQAMPRLRSGLRLQGCSSTPKKSTESGASGKPVVLSGDWTKDVESAKKANDEATMVALVKQALGDKYDVRTARKTSKTKVVAADYHKLPAINFDINLNGKERPTGGDLKLNRGLNFRDGKSGDKFAIIGPGALDPSSPLITRMYADHELYLAENKLVGTSEGRTSDDDELEAWSIDFTNYFHQYLSITANRPTWTPLLDYYASASNVEVKKASLAKLKTYYEKPVPDPKEAERVKDAFSLWVYKWKNREGAKNRKGDPLSKELIDELDKFVKPYSR